MLEKNKYFEDFGKNKANIDTLTIIKDTFNSMIKEFNSRFSMEEL